MNSTTPTQISFAEAEYAKKKKQTRRELFLAKMEQVVPWARLMEVIEPHYPKSGRRGRPPMGLERMLRMYFIQQWYGLADEAVEDAIYDSQALRQFLSIDLSQHSVPDATTLMGFRHLLEAHHLTQALLIEINAMLIERGLLMSKGTLVDATLIAAPSSTKNQRHSRDSEMHQTKKGNQYYFGIKAHIGADEESGLVHTVITTAANVSDISQTHALLHGQEQEVGADAGYVGVDKRADMQQALLKNEQDVQWRIAKRRTTIKKMDEGWKKELAQAYEKLKAKIRARVEHPFHVIKNLFRHRKTRYRGIAKNDAQLQMLFGLSNLYMMRESLRP
ncbi:IS5 family transposase [Undibacterium sp. SXout20W]|uniref:IS5 family transposase n=1 Tax=Undibacterium sp. SXout20W TaxID=3413051 RepID=UPI003BF00A71